MSRVLNVLCIVTLCACILKVRASRLKYPEFHDDDLSRMKHYEDDIHNPEYDHEAFLGPQEAQKWEKLPTDEVKQKLRQVALEFHALLFLSPMFRLMFIVIFIAVLGFTLIYLFP